MALIAMYKNMSFLKVYDILNPLEQHLCAINYHKGLLRRMKNIMYVYIIYQIKNIIMHLNRGEIINAGVFFCLRNLVQTFFGRIFVLFTIEMSFLERIFAS